MKRGFIIQMDNNPKLKSFLKILNISDPEAVKRLKDYLEDVEYRLEQTEDELDYIDARVRGIETKVHL